MASWPHRGAGNGTGTGTGPRPRRPAQTYEDFEPESWWAEDAENHILTIDLPGFTTEHVKVSTEDLNIIRVRGERPITRTRKSRFQRDFTVPENSDMNRVRAKLQGANLVITVGKKNIESPHKALSAKDTGAETPTPPITQHEQDGHPRPAEERKPIDNNNSDLTSSGPTMMKQDQADEPREGRKGTPFRDTTKILPQDYHINGIKEKHVTGKTEEREDKASKRIKESPDAGSAKKTNLKTANEGPTSAAAKENEESKGRHKIHTFGTDIGAPEMKTHDGAAKGLTEINGERQALVNMGVAVLVIMALSAYITYQFASGKHKS